MPCGDGACAIRQFARQTQTRGDVLAFDVLLAFAAQALLGFEDDVIEQRVTTRDVAGKEMIERIADSVLYKACRIGGDEFAFRLRSGIAGRG